MKLLQRVARDEKGTALIEYTILLTVVALGVIVAAGVISGYINTKWSTFCSAFTNSAGC